MLQNLQNELPLCLRSSKKFFLPAKKLIFGVSKSVYYRTINFLVEFTGVCWNPWKSRVSPDCLCVRGPRTDRRACCQGANTHTHTFRTCSKIYMFIISPLLFKFALNSGCRFAVDCGRGGGAGGGPGLDDVTVSGKENPINIRQNSKILRNYNIFCFFGNLSVNPVKVT